MNKPTLTPLEAWDDFYEDYRVSGKPIPNRLVVANATRWGRQKQKGKTKGISTKRMAELIEEYAPGKYQFHEAHFTKEI